VFPSRADQINRGVAARAGSSLFLAVKLEAEGIEKPASFKEN
jgi:hypothetical protein